MVSERDRKKHLKLFAKEQSYKDRLLKLQSQKLIDDLKGAEEIKKIQALLEDNQKKLEKLSKDNSELIDDNSLFKELSYQMNDMHNQLIVHKRKLVAYRELAKKFRYDLNKAEERKKDFLEEIGLDDEYIHIQSAVKLTPKNKVSKKTARNSSVSSSNRKVKKQTTKEPTPNTENETLLKTIESNTATVSTQSNDDISQIKGIKPKFKTLLNNEGIQTIDQIANWTEEEVKKRDKRLVFRGRIEREAWVEQAKQLLAKKK